LITALTSIGVDVIQGTQLLLTAQR
jgi:hypothetical protein